MACTRVVIVGGLLVVDTKLIELLEPDVSADNVEFDSPPC